MIRRWAKSLWRSDRGTALVESAIALPVFLTLVGGIYEFSFFLYQEQLVTSGVRDAARYLALTADPNSVANQIAAKNLAVSGSIDGGSPRVPDWNTSDVSVAINSKENNVVANNGGSPTWIVSVTTSYISPNLGFLGLFGLNKMTMSVSHQERYIGGSAPR